MRYLPFALLSVVLFGACTKDNNNANGEIVSSTGANVGSVSGSTGAFTFQMCDTRDLDTKSSNDLAASFGEYNKIFVYKNASSSANTTTIPVYFHVIDKEGPEGEGAVSDDALVEQIDVMNRAFSGESGGVVTPYRFSMGGINHVTNPKWFTMSPASQVELEAKQALRKGGAETLNVFIADIAPPDGGTGKILGYSTLPILLKLQPEGDGIVLNYRAVPGSDLENFNTGHVLVHETGHWLGLLHTFTGECDGFFTDLVIDTPREKPPGKGELCPTNRDSCPEAPGIDPIHNHMTYTSDGCRTEFTQGQVTFMRFNTLLFRGIM